MGTETQLPAVTEQPMPVIPIDMDAQAMVRTMGMGDVTGLSPEQQLRFIALVCRSVGLNPLTLPIRIIEMDGRKVLYATAEAGAQLRTNHKVSITVIERKEERGAYIVVVRASMPNGRTDEATGAVPTTYPDQIWDKNSRGYKPHFKAGKPVDGLAYCNAIKKAETQAKRRAALSIVGLGIPDESELDDMRRATVTSVVDTTETAADRGAQLLELTAETVTRPAIESTGTVVESSKAMSDNYKAMEAAAVTPAHADASGAGSPRVESQPVAPIAIPAATTAPGIIPTFPAPSALTDEKVARVISVFDQIPAGNKHSGKDCADFLIARSHLIKGSNLNTIKPDMADKIIAKPALLHRNVESWVATKG